jgi:hypothetical protein
MRKWSLVLLLVLAIVLFSILPTQVYAQEEVKLSYLEVDLWPEYDSPEMLVIYRITLPPTVSLPVDLTFRIPVSAGEPSAVAGRGISAEGEAGLFSIPYEHQVDGEWGLVTLTATVPELQLEYYDPGLVKQEAARQYAFQWPGAYEVDALTIQVQQPRDATGMSISPASGNGVPGEDGLIYYNKQVGSLLAGQDFQLAISYQKDSDSLTASSLQIQPSAPMTSMPTTQSSLLAFLPWVLGIFGVVLIVGGGVWYWQSGKGSESRSKPRRRRKPSAQSQSEAIPAEGHIYCHQCGKRAAKGDRFCRTCGTRLRNNNA